MTRHADSSRARDASTLDMLGFPLRGSRLIEASAGTGKTFTIAMLYVRLVLGHGRDTVGGGLMPPQILVMTFTEAATHELRERIRDRLAGAARCFLDESPGSHDEILLALRAEYPAEQRPACARRLQLAAEWMDEAAVFTIHAWCSRMLREHAFDCGSLFTQRLEPDQSELLSEAVRDFWRRFISPLDQAGARELARWWRSPEALKSELVSLLEHAELLAESPEPGEAIATARADRAAALARIKQPWPQWCEQLQALLDRARAGKQFDGQKLKQNNYSAWLKRLREWAEAPEMERPALKGDAPLWRRLTPEGLAEIWKAGDPPEHPALAAVRELPGELAALPRARAAILCFAARWVARRFAAEQREYARMGYNELLTELDAALRADGGERLAALVRRQFPAALIDEFQDTDPTQFRIVDAIYRVADPPADCALVLIGDPKQAIYSFRGADIHAYLQARRATGDRHYTLGTNFRSTGGMVAAVNAVFARAEQWPGGAFLFRRHDGDPLPFHEVSARGREETLLVDERPARPLTLWWSAPAPGGRPLAKEAAQGELSIAFAAGIARLLELGRQGRARFDGGHEPRALQPSDVAVLVNDGREAAAVRTALAQYGVRSVYLSERESVLNSSCADELRQWLRACAEPDNARLLRAALATPLLGLSWADLDALSDDELAWDDYVLQFRGYRQCWREQGVLPMLRGLLHDFRVPERVLGAHDGERVLTDLLHLAELLQHAATTREGEHALLRHFAYLRADGARHDEARRLRLESDADLVKVVTVHKAKGLEYPLVFLPFAASCRPVEAGRGPLRVHDADGRLQLVLDDADPGPLAQADRERLGEDVRKLYVALTRARHASWVGAAPVANLSRSALAYLLAGEGELSPAALESALQPLSALSDHIAVAPLPGPGQTRYQASTAAGPLGPARRMQRSPAEQWWIASYSALKVQTGGLTTEEGGGRFPPESAETAEEEIFREALGEAPSPLPAAVSETRAMQGMHRFPRGAAPGTFVHGLLEWAAETGFDRLAEDPERVSEVVTRRCAVRGWDAWSGTLTRWLSDYLKAPLPLPGSAAVALNELRVYQAELEFWFAAHEVDVARLDALVCQHTLDGMERPAVSGGLLNGMLKGFIDLVFEHRGRYYVADYKSNWLGPDESAYSPEAMRAAVAEKRYDLQYVLYLFALHRLLKARLPDYDYERHVGGAVYCFLRGVRASSRGAHCERPPGALMAALDEMFSASEGGA